LASYLSSIGQDNRVNINTTLKHPDILVHTHQYCSTALQQRNCHSPYCLPKLIRRTPYRLLQPLEGTTRGSRQCAEEQANQQALHMAPNKIDIWPSSML
jgi:hypothetical protein